LAISPYLVFMGSAGVSSDYGNGSDGDVIISDDTSLSATLDGDAVVKQYNSLVINSGKTLTVNNRCKGLIIKCAGDVTINGIIDMSALGARASGIETSFASEVGLHTVVQPGANAGANGSGIQTGGGGAGSTGGGYGGGGGNGGKGTAYCGGAGGGGGGGGITEYGGAGGSGDDAGTPGAGGGAYQAGWGGNGGQGGGVVVIIAYGKITIGAGAYIKANGSQGGEPGYGYGTYGGHGGGGGGGVILLLSRDTYTNSGTLEVSGVDGAGNGTTHQSITDF
jgi:hypothetical protein